MAGNIFINYRRDESAHVAGRLHDLLAPAFGHDRLFMDVDNIPVGKDFEDYLKSQVGACDAMLAVIGPNWLTAKDENGQRRLDNPNDFIVIEIGTALVRDIPVVPVLVDGARMPKVGELPDSLKLLPRRQAIQVRHTNFSSDADALVKKLREVLGYRLPKRRWLPVAIGLAVVTLLVPIGWGGYAYFRHVVERGVHQAELKREQERKAAEADAKRKADEAEQLRKQGEAAGTAGDVDGALAKFNEAIRLNSNDAIAYFDRGLAYLRKGDNDHAIADNNEAIRLSPNYSRAFNNRGLAYSKKGDFDRAIADYNEAIRFDPKFSLAFSNRGLAYMNKGDFDRAVVDFNDVIRLSPNASVFNDRGLAYARKGDFDRAIPDFTEAIRLNPIDAIPFYNRGLSSSRKGDFDRAIADYNEAIRLKPTEAGYFRSRGDAYAKKGNNDRAIADFTEAIRVNPNYGLAFCNRGLAKLKINDTSGNADIAKARELDPKVVCQ